MVADFTDDAENFVINRALIRELEKWSGTTVTIYTTSGGASGCGFTGVLTLLNPFIVRLITCIGPGPCCSLGSTCVTPCCPTVINGRRVNPRFDRFDRFERGRELGCITNIGATVDIPVENIVAFVHNSV